MIASTFFLLSASAMRTAATPIAHSARATPDRAFEAGPSAMAIPFWKDRLTNAS
jgi:hypothetical protein